MREKSIEEIWDKVWDRAHKNQIVNLYTCARESPNKKIIIYTCIHTQI